MDSYNRSLRNGLVCDALCRDGLMRDRPGWVETLLRSEKCFVVPVHRGRNLFERGPRSRAAILPIDASAGRIDPEALIYLGNSGGRRYFAYDLDGKAESEAWRSAGDGLFFGSLWHLGMDIEGFDASLLAYARGMCHWHRRTRFCGVCGHVTSALRAGHMRRCGNPECAAQHFPRTDPAVIVLVHRGERCLLANHKGWPRNNYSTLAGFVESGETVEQAVTREVEEETGIDVVGIRYRSSQPWPFPGSVMLGFHAEATTESIRLLDEEIVDARWFTRSELAAAIAGAGDLQLPAPISIARRLVEDWCNEAG